MTTVNDEAQFMPLTNISSSEGTENHIYHHDKSRSKSIKRVLTIAAKPLLVALLFCIIIIIVLALLLFTRSCGTTKPKLPFTEKKHKKEIHYYEDGRICEHQALRLPTDILPRQYNISLYALILPVVKTSGFRPTYYSNMTIETTCHKPTDYIVLQRGSDINITSLKVYGKISHLEMISKKFCESLSHDFLRLSKPCMAGEVVTIDIVFHCPILRKLDGFYLGTYKDEKRKDRLLASTHMEPISARKAFPCFDEPGMKARFVLDIIRDSRHVSLFNMPLVETVKDPMCPDCYRDKFNNSVLMSTYLVAFAVLPKDFVSLKRNVTSKGGNVEVGIWAPGFAKNSLEFSMNVTEKVLPYFEDLYDLPYPLPKLDMIAVPDFSAGAMENWGLIIYRFVTLLYDKNSTQTSSKQQVAEVVSHEIAHQWFGNIVTMEWWDDLWLNEGFATFTQYIGVNAFQPSWNMMDRCYLEFVYNALQTDSMLHSHPIIIVGVIDPEEIESLFDDISYFKGSSLILMLEDVIGMKALKEGLRIYLKRYAYRNAASKHLFASFSEGFHRINKDMDIPKDSPILNLPKVMDTWVYQQNYPLVTARIRGNKLLFTQERFLLYPNGTSMWSSYDSPYGYMWIVPIKYVTDVQKEPKLVWLNMEREKTIELDHEPKYVKINIRQTGLYRSNYDESNWWKLVELSQQGSKTLTTTDKAGLINDAFALTYSGRLNVTVTLALVESLKNEKSDSSVAWAVAIKKMSEAYGLLMSEEETLIALTEFVTKIIHDPLQELTKKPLDLLTHTERIKYVTLTQVAVVFNEPKIVARLKQEYDRWRRNTSYHLDPDETDLVYQVGVGQGNRTDWDFFWSRYQNAVMQPSEAKSVMSALSLTQDLELIYRLIENSLDLRKLRRQDTINLVVRLSRQPAGLDLVWTFLMRNWGTIMKRYRESPFLISEITKIPESFRTEYDFQRTKEFFERNKLSSGQRNAYQSLESIRANTDWVKYNTKDFARYLKAKMRKLTNSEP